MFYKSQGTVTPLQLSKNENSLPKVQQRHIFFIFFFLFMLDSNLICPLKYGIVNKIT